MRTLTLQQGSPEWLAHRRTTRNASDAPAMMGASPYVTRAELVRRAATGVEREIDERTQAIFDRGHEVEPKLRALAESIIGEDLYPVTGVSDDGYLGASFDGVNLDETIIFEAKQSNTLKMASIEEGVIPAADYWQIVHQFAVCESAHTCFYFVGDGTEDGTRSIAITRCEVSDDIPKLLSGWAQFDADVAAYVPEPVKAEVVAAPVVGFGALSLRVEGRVIASNLDTFKADAEAFIARLPRPAELQTDQDFVDAEAAVKACAEAESRIKAATDAALAQMADVDSLLRAAGTVSEAIRAARLALDKAVKIEKENRKSELVQAAAKQVRDHFDSINASLGEHRIQPPQSLQLDLGGAIKGKKSLSSMQDALGSTVAQHKIAASQTAERVRANVAILAEHADHASLFADRVTLCATKAPDDLRNLCAARIAEHERREAERLEAERERIRQEEAARIERERAQAELAAAKQAPEGAELSPLAQAMHEAEGAQRFAEHNPKVAAVQDSGKRLRLGDINAAIAPLTITADGLAQLGFKPVGTDRATKLYAAADFPHICGALARLVAEAPARMLQQAAA